MNTQPAQIKAFVFDAYGTLFDVYGVTSLCDELFPDRGAALATMWRAKQLQYTLLRSLMDRYEDFWQITGDSLTFSARSLGLDLTSEKRERLMQAYLTLPAFPDAKAGLEQLKAPGIRLAILSNGQPKMLAAAAAAAGLSQLLDAVISVDEVRTYKPSPLVYGLVARRLGVTAAQTWFVSANSWDVEGAASAGLTAFWIQRSSAEPAEELGWPAAGIVRAITDLPAVLTSR